MPATLAQVLARTSPELCRVLCEDPDLAEVLPLPERRDAMLASLARVLSIRVGNWDEAQCRELNARLGEGPGLLVLGGVLMRRIVVAGRSGAELLGPGDVFRPMEFEQGPSTLSVTGAWRVMEPARMAVLDESFVTRSSRYALLNGRLVGRVVARCQRLAVSMAIMHQPRVEVRVHMLLWHLADRWGRVGPTGVTIPLKLTHSDIADMAAARRPTVSTALATLARREVVMPSGRGWLIAGPPPDELSGLLAGPRHAGSSHVAVA